MYDVTDRGSFQAIKTWVEEIEKNAERNVNKILVGNKCDVDERVRAHLFVCLSLAGRCEDDEESTISAPAAPSS